MKENERLLFHIQTATISNNKWTNKLSVVCDIEQAKIYYKETAVKKNHGKRLYCPSKNLVLHCNRLKYKKAKSKCCIKIMVSDDLDLISMNEIMDELRYKRMAYNPEIADYNLSEFLMWLAKNPPDSC